MNSWATYTKSKGLTKECCTAHILPAAPESRTSQEPNVHIIYIQMQPIRIHRCLSLDVFGCLPTVGKFHVQFCWLNFAKFFSDAAKSHSTLFASRCVRLSAYCRQISFPVLLIEFCQFFFFSCTYSQLDWVGKHTTFRDDNWIVMELPGMWPFYFPGCLLRMSSKWHWVIRLWIKVRWCAVLLVAVGEC